MKFAKQFFRLKNMLEHMVATQKIKARVRKWQSLAIEIKLAEFEIVADFGKVVAGAAHQVDTCRLDSLHTVALLDSRGEIT